MKLNTIDLTPILQAVIALLAAIITAKVIPWIKSKTTAQQQSALMTTVRILVYAAEQLYGAGRGEEKLDYVCDQLRLRGYDVNRAEIEATVYAEFKGVLPLQELTVNAPEPERMRAGSGSATLGTEGSASAGRASEGEGATASTEIREIADAREAETDDSDDAENNADSNPDATNNDDVNGYGWL